MNILASTIRALHMVIRKENCDLLESGSNYFTYIVVVHVDTYIKLDGRKLGENNGTHTRDPKWYMRKTCNVLAQITFTSKL
jgi:hypothetical protein